ncbi:hypothetical protein BABINDRAFT_33255 [Babjeviella inositovora NRRL Y-12698]|uniref:NADPH-dependent diflavin oxidoreductase 1 n=1 Tax=Babjeviella inositovora NRRL Y-12698 TaxID=984486 RepID=A0A1E3QVL5_9ASCO|nr:uncharacterized protein BABINDRAFT_33255 [Babjeviella inositovora NRRL Y-12698]ODQ81700.1 hypothetical protein BABINDRAFT_33255 [Babjeviella inositovora NRRL Y-12698]
MSRAITILYGSETGNAQDYAQILSKRLRFLRFATTVSTLGDYDVRKLLSTGLLVVICSTTGQGELPRNSKAFLRFLLKKKLPADLLSHLSFTSFGLGDSSYVKFNYAAKKLHNRLLQLGATECSPRAESDEQSPEGTDGYYSEWEAILLANLNEQYPLPPGIEPIPEIEILPPTNPVEICETDNFNELLSEKSHSLILGEIVRNDRITASNHFQDVRHLVIHDTSGSLDFQPGDTVGLYPTNDPVDVFKLIENQGWEAIADRPLRIQHEVAHIEGGLINNLTLRTLLTHHLDIMSVPRRSFFWLAWHFSDDEREKEKLHEFSDIKEAEELFDYANRPRRSILETILEFSSLRIPVEYLFDLIPTIKLRQFSIASQPDPNRVELAIALVEYKTILRRARKGVCSSWVKTLNVGDRIVFSVHRSQLKFGDTQPLVMVAPGTGVAPMKSLIEYKVGLSLAEVVPQKLTLFYGCRFHDKDFLFGTYWKRLAEEQKLELSTSFSREKGGYVQHALYKQRKAVCEQILAQKGIIFICGSNGSMPREVRITFEAILEEEGKMSKEEARKYILQMENEGRYIQETW